MHNTAGKAWSLGVYITVERNPTHCRTPQAAQESLYYNRTDIPCLRSLQMGTCLAFLRVVSGHSP